MVVGFWGTSHRDKDARTTLPLLILLFLRVIPGRLKPGNVSRLAKPLSIPPLPLAIGYRMAASAQTLQVTEQFMSKSIIGQVMDLDSLPSAMFALVLASFSNSGAKVSPLR